MANMELTKEELKTEYDILQKLYLEAKQEGKLSFIYKNQEMLVSYCMYLLQHLKTKIQ